MLPPYFEWEDYGSCINNGNDYCKVQGTLQVPVSNESLYNFFQERKNNDGFLDPSIIYRAICLNKQEMFQYNTTISNYLSSIINRKIEKYFVSFEMENYICTDGKAHINTFDIFILIAVILYSSLILYATFCDKKTPSKGPDNVLSHFSLYKSWKTRTDLSKIKLLHFNSIRAYAVALVILIHMVLIWSTIYVENPHYFGEAYMIRPNTIYLRKFLNKLVLGFFLISSWLATVRIYKIVEEHGKLSLKHVGIILINRYARYIAAPIFVILSTSNWKYLISGPMNFDLLVQTDEVCKSNWLPSILCISNFYRFGNICNMHTWFISADFQMYVMNVLLHYVIFKKNLNRMRTYIIVSIGWCCLHGCVLYWYNMGTGFTPTTRNMGAYHLYKSIPFLIGYMSTLANASSSFVGVILGYIYFTHKEKTFTPSYLQLLLWRAVGITSPLATVWLSAWKGATLHEVILGSICRPMGTLSVGFILMGLSFGLGGFVKKFTDSKYVVILGNFSFSIFVCHFICCQYSHISVPPRLTFRLLWWDYWKVVAISIVMGIVFGLAVEEPCASLQTRILPQVEKSRKITEKSE